MAFSGIGIFFSACVFYVMHNAVLGANPLDNCRNAKKILDILPGRGWDSLENKDLSQLVQLTYNECKTTSDGVYLIPDYMSAIPIRETDMKLSVELFEHYVNYTTLTSKSYTAGVAFPFSQGAVTVAGSFSPEYQQFKSSEIQDKAMSTRVHIRSTRYSIRVEPSFQLKPDLKRRLEKAGGAIESGIDEDYVRSLVELIVLDYGTHFQNRVDAGAMLIKEDFIKSSFVRQNWGDRNQITAAAGVSFLDMVSFGFRYTQTVDKEKADGYNSSVISTTLSTVGGPVIDRNMTEYDWLSKIPENLATIDREGEPLYHAITENNFPNMSLNTRRQLQVKLKDAIVDYFLYNTHKGCMSMDSPNFDPHANVDDQSCQNPATNYTFGGLFVNCTSLEEEAGNLCMNAGNPLHQNNLLTGKLSCPPEFIVVPVNSAEKTIEKNIEKSNEVCTGWWIFSKCHTETEPVTLRSKAHYDSFWCAAANPSASNNTGLMFGGLFTSTNPNPVTKWTSCPDNFTPLHFGVDLTVCASNDFELGFRYSLAFGGFFSCAHGNPLAHISESKINQSAVYISETESFPHYCPPGFSQHMAAVDSGCGINYCLRNGALDFQIAVFPLVKPPFKKEIKAETIGKAVNQLMSGESSLGTSAIIFIVVIAGILSVAVIVLVVMKIRARRKSNTSSYVPFGNEAQG